MSLSPSSAAIRIPYRPSVLILTSWTGSEQHRKRTYTHRTNSFPLPGTAKGLLSPKRKNRKPMRQCPNSPKLSKNSSQLGRISLVLLSCRCPAFHGMQPHTKGTLYRLRRWHRRAYPCLPRGRALFFHDNHDRHLYPSGCTLLTARIAENQPFLAYSLLSFRDRSITIPILKQY